ncbi:hypothetical protein [Streptomyces sp. NPDC058953]|uniref:hypothetical protein n=1 Tax=unclassified Streptomyces TaxID=2593676 RepID=UPI0036C33C8E
MSGHEIPPLVLLPAFAVACATGWLAGTRRRGPLFIGTGLLAGQVAMHLLYAGAQGHSAPMGRHGPDPLTVLEQGLPAGGAPISGTGMIAVHLLTAAIGGLWLARGEEAFLQLARALGALAFVPLRSRLVPVRAPELPGRVAAPRTTAAERPGGAVVLGHILVRRGPPGPLRTSVTASGAAV